METSKNTSTKNSVRPIIGVAVLSMLVCGLFFPALVTAVGQVLFPSQANGDLATLNGKPVGSYLIAQTFTLPIFFHPRNASASGVDPDITLQDALSQVPRISDATGIPASSIQLLVDQNVDLAGRLTDVQYVNVLALNVLLIDDYPTVYSQFS